MREEFFGGGTEGRPGAAGWRGAGRRGARTKKKRKVLFELLQCVPEVAADHLLWFSFFTT